MYNREMKRSVVFQPSSSKSERMSMRDIPYHKITSIRSGNRKWFRRRPFHYHSIISISQCGK